MNRVIPSAALSAAVFAALVENAHAQQCYANQSRCFSFAPPGSEIEKIETGLNLRSEQFKLTGDIRFRQRLADSPSDAPYNGADQGTTRARLQLDYRVNEWASAFVEFNFSEVWAGAEPYSDAEPFQNDPNGIDSRENFNGISQAYMQLDDAFGLGESIRIGRSYYHLGNGLVLGSCDYLQYPGTFTGIWVSRSFGPVDAEIFAFDNYGPLQAQIAGGGEKFAGGTARWNVTEDGLLEDVDAYFMSGTGDGDNINNANDSWAGLEFSGNLPAELDWELQLARRDRDLLEDLSAYRAVLGHTFEKPVGGFLRGLSVTRTDSEGALHINPADFNAAGLLHQYAGPWRSHLETNQLAAQFTPGADIDCTATIMTLDRDQGSPQLGDTEFDLIAGKMIRPGLHTGLGYGIDNDGRQVGFLQVTLYF
jgi:hypothetical protein